MSRGVGLVREHGPGLRIGQEYTRHGPCAIATPTTRSERRRMGLETLLVSLYAIVDEWWRRNHPRPLRRAGRPPSLSEPEVLTLAILLQWPRWRSERDFRRFADVYLRVRFPNPLSQGRLNRRIRALEPGAGALQRSLAESLVESSEVRHVLDTTLIPAVARVGASEAGKGLCSPGRPPSEDASRKRSGPMVSMVSRWPSLPARRRRRRPSGWQRRTPTSDPSDSSR